MAYNYTVVEAATEKHLLDGNASYFRTQAPDSFIRSNAGLSADLTPFETTNIWIRFDDDTVFCTRIMNGDPWTYAHEALQKFLDDGGTIEGQDEIVLPDGYALRNL